MNGRQIVLTESRNSRPAGAEDFARQADRLARLAVALHWGGAVFWALLVFLAGFAAGWVARGAL